MDVVGGGSVLGRSSEVFKAVEDFGSGGLVVESGGFSFGVLGGADHVLDVFDQTGLAARVGEVLEAGENVFEAFGEAWSEGWEIVELLLELLQTIGGRFQRDVGAIDVFGVFAEFRVFSIVAFAAPIVLVGIDEAADGGGGDGSSPDGGGDPGGHDGGCDGGGDESGGGSLFIRSEGIPERMEFVDTLNVSSV